jgi:hypothetical protein
MSGMKLSTIQKSVSSPYLKFDERPPPIQTSWKIESIKEKPKLNPVKTSKHDFALDNRTYLKQKLLKNPTFTTKTPKIPTLTINKSEKFPAIFTPIDLTPKVLNSYRVPLKLRLN